MCAGQQKAAQLGYSPLPKNLVQDAFNVVTKIPGHVNPPPINQCDNPTITQSFVAGDTAPPPPSDKQGATPPSATPTVTAPPTGNQVQTGVVQPVTAATTAVTGAHGKGVKKAAGAAVAQQAVDGGSVQQALVAATGPVTPPSPRDPMPLLLYVVAAIVALVAIFGPPALAMYLRKPESP